MDKVLGIIAEYNPFHNGHLYHLENSKKLTGCEYSVAVISGNFTQRGSTSLVDKWQKTKMALSNGVDLVIELPTLYSISSAENFADGSIKILNSLGIIDFLSFGTETDNISLLDNVSNILYNEPIDYKEKLSKELKKGLSFPKARENALLSYLNSEDFLNILSLPNNILGIEYLKSLKKNKSDIKPICVKRYKSQYNSTETFNNIASSTAIRDLLKNKDFDKIKNLVPKYTFSILNENIKNGHFVANLSVFEKEIIYTLRKMPIEEIANLPDVSEGLEFSIKDASNSCNNLFEFLNILKSKRYTLTRLQRILLYVLLGITKKDMEISKNILPYIRVLGFNKNGKHLISEIYKRNPNINLVTSVKKFVDNNNDKNLERLLDIDIFSTNVFTLEFDNNSFCNLDFKNDMIKI